MNASSIRTVCSLIPTLFLVCVWFYFLPGGAYGGIFIVLALIAAGSLYVSFYAGGASLMITGSIGMVFLLGSIGVAARGSFDDKAYQHLSDVIKPLPGQDIYQIQELSRGPGLRKGQVIWDVKTPLTQNEILSFYQLKDTAAAWKRISAENPIVFTKEHAKIVIKITPGSGVTRVRYDYRGPRPDQGS